MVGPEKQNQLIHYGFNKALPAVFFALFFLALFVFTVQAQIPNSSLSFSANPPSINSGQSSTLTWSSTHNSCKASGAWSGGKGGSGSESVKPSITSTYTLACPNSVLPNIIYATGSVTVTVTPLATTTSSFSTTTILNVPNPVKADNLTDLLADVANFIFIIAIPISVIVILISGIRYLLAGGNEDKIKAARQALIWAAIGLVIILIGKGIISVIQSLLNVTTK